MDELKQNFSLDALSKSPSVFDYEKLKWFNSEYIKMLSEEEFYQKAMPVMKAYCPDNTNLEKLCKLLHTRISTFGELETQTKFICERLPMNVELYTNKTNPEVCKNILEKVLPVLLELVNWDNDTLFATLKDEAASIGLKAGAIMWAVRIAVADRVLHQVVRPKLWKCLVKKSLFSELCLQLMNYSKFTYPR